MRRLLLVVVAAGLLAQPTAARSSLSLCVVKRGAHKGSVRLAGTCRKRERKVRIVAPRGSAGPQGPAGLAGPAGTTGPTGPAGTFAFPQELSGAAAIGLSVTNTAADGTPVAIRGAAASDAGGDIDAAATGLLGEITSTNAGGYTAGVRGINRGTGGTGMGVVGLQDGSGVGVYGETPDGDA